jgi:hypothetical protein
VEFLILGSAAVSLHGFPRMTTDIDILLKNSPDNLDRFVTAMGGWGEGFGADLIEVLVRLPVQQSKNVQRKIFLDTHGRRVAPCEEGASCERGY